MSTTKIREYLRTQASERLPELLKIYSADPLATTLIHKEINRRQALVQPSKPTL
ncbi:hypothetical protein [uncultured Hymenobacter sp.]|uniref:hypothetical protein n=1 Tax=uncultured Hymenobacter sp. TaxID=170016 RepID=UPI0035CADA03